MEYNRDGIGEIHPANCQLTAANVAAIAMIINKAVWIHGLIKHCLRSWTAARTNFAISTLVFAKWQSRPPRENMSTTSDVTCSAMHVKQRDREPWIQIGKWSRSQNFENIVMDSCANFRECPFVGFHARSRKPRRSWIHGVKFSKWRTSGNRADASAFHQPKLKSYQLLNHKDSMQNIDTIIH